jgi:hypothetical protein
VVVIFGTAEPNPQQLIDECLALYSDDLVPISCEPLPQDHRHRKDERLETLLLMRREEEMEQAAHRPRPVWAKDSPRTIVVMSQLDLPGLPADEVIDPRAIESMKRKDLLAGFITDCVDQMCFYFDGLAELAGVVKDKSKTVAELRQRLDGTGSLIGYDIRQPVQAGGGTAPMYPSNRNAFYRDRDAFFNEIQLPSENLTFELVGGAKATIKVWGNAQAAKAWLSFLVSDHLKPSKRFTMVDLLAVCEQYQIQMEVLFSAPTVAKVYGSVFDANPTVKRVEAATQQAVWVESGDG